MSKHNHNHEKESLSIDGIRRSPQFATAVPKPTLRLGRVAANHYVKIAGTVCFVILILTQLSSIGSTVSYFSDIENSLGNFFVADPLYFSIEASSTTPIVLAPQASLVLITMQPGELSDPIQYQIKTSVTGGDTALCNAIKVFTTAPYPYDGPLANLTSGFITDTGPWTLNVSLPESAQVTPDASCTVDVVYEGWNASSTPGQGYTDTQKVSLIFVAPSAPAPQDTPSTTTSQSTTTSPTAPSDDTSITPPVDTTADASTTDATTTDTTTTPTDTPAPDAATTTTDTTTPPPAGVPAPDTTPPADATAPSPDTTTPVDAPPSTTTPQDAPPAPTDAPSTTTSPSDAGSAQ